MKNKIVVCNIINKSSAEKVVFQGEPAWKIPTVAIRIGAWNKVLYEDSVLAQYADMWNGVPVCIGHPKDENDNFVKCASSQVFDTNVVGNFFDVRYEDGKLLGNMYVFERRLQELHPTAFAKVSSNIPIENSTSMEISFDEIEGEFENNKYELVCRGMLPDHLALLPDEKGACSIADGCGTLQNQKIQANCVMVVDNQKLISEMEHDVREVVRAKHPNAYVHIFDIDIESSIVYYEVEQENGTATNVMGQVFSGTELVDEPFAVKRRTVYSTNASNKEEETMDKEKFVAKLIANAATKFEEDDKEFLLGLTECQLKKLEPVEAKPVKTETVANEKTDETPEPEKGEGLTKDDIEQLMRKVTTDVVNSLMKEKERSPLISALVANKNCPLGEKSLKALDDDELRKLAKQMQVGTTDFSMRGLPLMQSVNQEEIESELPDAMPSILLATDSE